MPLRDFRYNAPLQFEPEHTGSFNTQQDFSPTATAQPSNDPSFLGASFRQGNWIGSLLSYSDLTRSPPDPNFNAAEEIERRGLLPFYNRFLDVRNQKDFDDVERGLRREIADSERISREGWALNLVTQLGVGVLDPFVAVPVLKIASASRAGMSVARSMTDFALAGAASALPGAVVRERTQALMGPEEALLEVGAAAVLSNAIGLPISRMLDKSRVKALNDYLNNEDFSGDDYPLKSVGAAAMNEAADIRLELFDRFTKEGMAPERADELAKAAAEDRIAGFFVSKHNFTGRAFNEAKDTVKEYLRRHDPTLTLFLSRHPETRRLGAELAPNNMLELKHLYGYKSERSIHTKFDVLEGRLLNRAVADFDQLYADLFLKGKDASRLRTEMRSVLRFPGQVSKIDFDEMITGARRWLQNHPTLEGAQFYSSHIDNWADIPNELHGSIQNYIIRSESAEGPEGYVRDMAIRQGLLRSPESEPDGVTPAARSFWTTRIINHTKYNKDKAGFRNAVEGDVRAKIVEARDERLRIFEELRQDLLDPQLRLFDVDDYHDLLAEQLRLSERAVADAASAAGVEVPPTLTRAQFVRQTLDALEVGIGRARDTGTLSPDDLAALDNLRTKTPSQYTDADVNQLARLAKRYDARIERASQFELIESNLKAAERLAQKVEDEGLQRTVRRLREFTKRGRVADKRINAAYDKYESLMEMTEADITDIVNATVNKLIEPELGDAQLPTPYLQLALRRKGVAGPFRAKLPIADEVLAPWLENKYTTLMQAGTKKALRDLLIKERFGSIDGIEQRRMIERVHDGEIARLTKQLSEDGANKRAIEKEISREESSKRAELRAFDALMRRLRGVDGIPENPRGIANATVQNLLGMTLLSKLGNVVLGSLADTSKLIMRQGMTGVFGDIVLPLARGLMSKEGRRAIKLNLDERKLAGVMSRWWNDATFRRIGGLNEDYQPRGAFSRTIDNGVNWFGLMSGMSPWNNFWKAATTFGVQNSMLKTIRAIGQGKRVPQGKIARLAQRHISTEQAKAIYAQEWQHVTDIDGILVANTDKWSNREWADDFLGALREEAETTITTPGLDKPIWMTQGWLKLLAQFRTFDAASVARTFIPIAQERTAAMLYGSLFAVGMGMLSTWARASLLGHDLGDLSDEDDLAGLVYAGVDRAGLFPWALSLNNTAEDISRSLGTGAFGLRPLTETITGLDVSRPIKYRPNTLSTAVAGASTAIDAAKVLFDVTSMGADAQTVRTFRRLLPLQSMAGLHIGYDAAEEATINALGLKR